MWCYVSKQRLSEREFVRWICVFVNPPTLFHQHSLVTSAFLNVCSQNVNWMLQGMVMLNLQRAFLEVKFWLREAVNVGFSGDINRVPCRSIFRVCLLSCIRVFGKGLMRQRYLRELLSGIL